ncbi:YbaB/EbfC family nucleoid-associated protein [Catenuloplanes japonicus]|uniref:YbaB/EbfC family nucleoid-associated protein n=1 Tax=Catenuloplanes japonicus TaxID=33876 RepID=UPI00068E8687|nr:YbaB/EbfC family nucleoid-associated protein [Catenuloplanes japonicus]
MTGPLHNQIEEAYAELERQREELAEVQSGLGDLQTTVTSKNRALSVTVNSQGRLTSIVFPSNAYRTMAGAELAGLLIDTIEQARTDAMHALVGRFESIMPSGLPMLDLFTGDSESGGIDLDAMVREAVAFADRPLMREGEADA